MAKLAALISAFLVLGSCSTIPVASDEQSVTFSRRMAYGVCTGLCPSFDLTLTPSGWVEVQRYSGLKEHFRFQVRRSAAARAIAKIAKIRSGGRLGQHGPCAIPLNAEPELFDPKVEQFAIEWRDREVSKRLAFCFEDKSLTAAFKSAMTELGVDPSGSPFVRQRLDGSRYGQRVSCDLGNGQWSPPRFDCDECPSEAIKSSSSSVQFYAVDKTSCRSEP
jgi:hypothetical protein